MHEPDADERMIHVPPVPFACGVWTENGLMPACQEIVMLKQNVFDYTLRDDYGKILYIGTTDN